MNNDQNKSFIGILILFTAVMGAVGLTHLGNVLTPVTGDLPWNPFTLGIQLATGAVDWPTAATFLVGLEVLAGVAALMIWGTRTPSKTQEAARRMSPPGRINPAMGPRPHHGSATPPPRGREHRPGADDRAGG